MRTSLGRSHGRRVGAKRSAKRERIAPLVVEYVKANPNAKIQSVADLFGASTKMVWTIIAERILGKSIDKARVTSTVLDGGTP